MKFTGTKDDDEEVIMEEENSMPSNGIGQNRPVRRSAVQSLKKMKIDEEQQVKDIFGRDQAQDTQHFDLSVKKYVFKLIRESTQEAGGKLRVPIASVWQKYFNLDDEMQKNPGTSKHYFQNKQEMKRAIESMEADDLVMISGDDVIITT